MASRSRSPSRGRPRSYTRSMSPQSRGSRPPPRRRSASRSYSRSRSPSRSLPRRNGRFRSASRSVSRSRSRSRSWSRSHRGRASREPSESVLTKSTKIVVERLSKSINEDHLFEIFGQFGPIKDLDLPINRTYGTNRGTAYILFDHEADAEAAISHMHEAQVDGATINVSIVLPRRKISPAPPVARRGANIDPRVPMGGRGGGGPPGRGGFHGGARRRPSPPGRYGPRSDVYRPPSRSQSPGGPPSRGGGGGGGGARGGGGGGGGSRYRSRSYSSRSPSPGAARRRGGGWRGGNGPRGRGGRGGRFDGHDDRRRSRSPSYGSRGRSRSPPPRGYR